MSRELDRCSERCSQTELQLRQALLTLMNASGMDTSTKLTDRFMSCLDNHIEAKMDLREAQHADYLADARDY